MNWKLIGQLSLIGLAMAIATVYVIPSRVEWAVWIPLFFLCAYLIAARVARLHFVHGLLVGIANSLWVTLVHVLLFDAYLAHHPKEAQMMASSAMPLPPRVMMACVGPIVGVITGVVIGLLAVVAAWIVRRGERPAAAS